MAPSLAEVSSYPIIKCNINQRTGKEYITCLSISNMIDVSSTLKLVSFTLGRLPRLRRTGSGELCVGMAIKNEVNEMKNEHVIIAALAIALAGTGYYAYTEHQQVQALQEQVDSKNKQLNNSQGKIMDLLATVQDLKNENADLRDQVDNQPAPAAAQSDVSVSDIMRQMDEDDLRQKESDYLDKQSEYLDKVNRKLDDEYLSQDVKMKDFSK